MSEQGGDAAMTAPHPARGADQPADRAADPDPAAGGIHQQLDWSWTAADPRWIPPDIDVDRPSAARIYNYALGGKDNFEVDRRALAQIIELCPSYPALALANRGFLVRAVHTMARSGIDQFLDLGTGIPASPSVHDVAQLVHPHARVVYVDNDPLVIAQNRALRGTYPGVIAACHDLRQPNVLLADPLITSWLDFDRPVGVLLTSVLHFVRCDLAPQMVTRYRRALAPGSQIAISVACRDGTSPDLIRRLEEVFATSPTPMTFRSAAQIEQLLEGLELTGPGLIDVAQWQDGVNPAVVSNAAAANEPAGLSMLAGLGRVV
jgi:S-adenosyl methyltransferase